MVVVPSHVEGNILVEVEVPSVAIVRERLESGHDGTPGRHQLLAAQKMGMKYPKCLASILGLRSCRARVGPRLGSSPGCVEDVIHLRLVLEKGWVKWSMFLEVVQWASELPVGKVDAKDWCASDELSVDRRIWTVSVTEGRWVFWSVFGCVKRSLALRADHIL